MRIKRIASFLLAAAVTLTPLVHAGALWESAGGSMSLQWVNTDTVDVSITLSGSTATCKAIIEGLSGTTHIKADLRLYKQASGGSWTPVNSWLNLCVHGD
jgi:hypothetical protein